MGDPQYICRVFIRKKHNKSGSVSIQVLKKEGRKNVLIKSIGSSSDPKQINQLYEEARNYIDQLIGQTKMDLFSKEESDWFDNSFNQISNIALLGPDIILGKIFEDIGFSEIKESLFGIWYCVGSFIHLAN